ncbi:MAG TPA: hypothetical protein VMH06_03590 [Thermodesulfovibrionales bacterium]|nr:hypothetical protein [Thermodesulfovibrionales bacterium]
MTRRAAFFVLFVILSPCFLSGQAHALYAEPHTILSYEASLLQEVPSELRVYVGDPGRCFGRFGDSICGGAYDEDADRDPRLSGFNPGTLLGLLNWGTHFWQPDGGPAGGRLDNIGGFPVNLDHQNAYQRAWMLYESAKSLYPTDPIAAYYTLGRVTHLLEDMATPAHVHLDPHIGDESTTGDDSFEEYTAEKYVYPDPFEGIVALEKDFPPAGLSAVDYTGLSDGGFTGEPPLFKLFYSMARSSDDYDSDDADGKVDAGARRGMSVKVSRTDLSAVSLLRSGYPEEALPSGYRTSPARAKFILLNSAIEMLKNANPPYDGVRLAFSDATAVYSLAEFTRTDIGDEDMDPIRTVLLPAATGHVAALYQLFWRETHTLPADGGPEIRLNRGVHRLQIAKPSAIDLRIDVAGKGSAGNEAEIYVWADVPSEGSTLKFYFDGQWRPFTDLSAMKPVLPSFVLADVQNAVWRIIDDTQAAPETSFSVNLCIDMNPDGRYTPGESVCDGVLITVGN